MTLAPRAAAKSAFIAASGWGAARVAPLAGDASNRRYDRLTDAAGRSAVLMDADPARGEALGPFLAIDRLLAGFGLSVPAILAEDRVQGFLLIEDLGDDLFARLAARDPGCQPALYAAATDVLGLLHRQPVPADLAPYDAATMGRFSARAIEWYLPGATGREGDLAGFAALVAGLRETLAPGQPVIVLRDFHAENLLWLPQREGTARVGLLDFQDAMTGPRAYDLVSMLQDARRDVPEEIEAEMVARYAAANAQDPEAFAAEYAFCGAQRNLRILGGFARLSMEFSKPQYIDLIPRVWRLLARDLAHPALAELARLVAETLPPPDAAILARLRAACGSRAA